MPHKLDNLDKWTGFLKTVSYETWLQKKQNSGAEKLNKWDERSIGNREDHMEERISELKDKSRNDTGRRVERAKS